MALFGGKKTPPREPVYVVIDAVDAIATENMAKWDSLHKEVSRLSLQDIVGGFGNLGLTLQPHLTPEQVESLRINLAAAEGSPLVIEAVKQFGQATLIDVDPKRAADLLVYYAKESPNKGVTQQIVLQLIGCTAMAVRSKKISLYVG